MTTHSLGAPVIATQSFLTVDPAKNRIYVTGQLDFTNPDGSFGAVGTTITVNGSDYSSTFVQEPAGSTTLEEQITVDPNTSQVYSLGVGGTSNKIMHFDPSANGYVNVSGSNLAATSSTAPARSHQLAMNPNTDRVYLPSLFKNTGLAVGQSPGGLLAVDGSTMQATGGSPLGASRQSSASRSTRSRTRSTPSRRPRGTTSWCCADSGHRRDGSPHGQPRRPRSPRTTGGSEAHEAPLDREPSRSRSMGTPVPSGRSRTLPAQCCDEAVLRRDRLPS